MGVSKNNGWFRMENRMKMDGFGVPLFSETPIQYLNKVLFPGRVVAVALGGVPLGSQDLGTVELFFTNVEG